ncbi:MAG: 50S ribosomal protein L21 [Clostridia bacterium]|nr:50S ribosomal protein L21 [Clostridia bacterium]
MYAIMVAGGKQFKVEQDSLVKVELLNEVKANDTVKFAVEMLNKDGEVLVGNNVKDAYVEATVIKENGKGPKIDIFKYKSKKNVRKHQGHRQPYTLVKITKIVG